MILMMLFKLTTILSISLLTAALPYGIKEEDSYGRLGNFCPCSVSNATITFPEGQTALSIPPGQVPSHIFFGMGVQNYTCSASGTYTYAPGHGLLQQVANWIIM